MLRLELLLKNLEATVCFALFGILLFVSAYLLRPDMGRMDPSAPHRGAPGVSQTQTKYMAARREAWLKERRILIGSIMAKPISHYGLILKRNPFAPIPPFKGLIIQPGDFILMDAPSRETGRWIAHIQHRTTGEVYSVGEGEQIAGVLRVKKIEADRVILSWKESYDVVIEAPAIVDTSDDFILVSVPSRLEQNPWVARIENRRTGEVYSVQTGEQIAKLFIVKEINAERVVITDGTQEIILTPPPPPLTEPTVDLILTGTMYLPEQKAWIAQIENHRTGEIYIKREGEQIADIFTVTEIQRTRLILSREEKEDIVLRLGQTGD